MFRKFQSKSYSLLNIVIDSKLIMQNKIKLELIKQANP